MSDWSGLGKALIVVGGLVALVGLLLVLAGRFFGGGLGWLGRLPGDIYIKQDHFTFYFPLATSLLLSVVLSLILYFLSKW